MPNVFGDILEELSQEGFDLLLETPSVRIERIVSHGHSSPDGFWYDQDTDEWVLVLKGRARLRLEGVDEPLELEPGDYMTLPAHQRHRVEWTTPDEPTLWLAIHYHSDPSAP